MQRLQASLAHAGLPARGVLLHYTDPFLLRAQPLRGLHHGERPLDVLEAYLES